MNKLLEKYCSMPQPAKAALWFAVCGALQKCVAVVTTPIFTRLLTTAEYGQYTLFNSWLEILGVILTLRLSYGVFMQGLIRYDHDKDEYTSSLMGLTTLLVLAGTLLYVPLRGAVNSLTGLNTFLTLCMLASAWAVAMFGFWSARQRIEYKYRALVAVTLAVAVITPVAGICAVLSTAVFKVEARVFVLVAVEVAVYGAMFVHYMRKGRKFFSREFWIHALKFNLPLVPHYLSQSALSQADRVMINAIVSSSAAGIYGLAASISSAANFVNTAINNTLNPWIYQHIRSGDAASIARVSYLAIAGVGAMNLAVIALAPEIVALFAPSEYQDAVWIVPPLAASTFVTFMYSLFADFEFYYERTGLVMWASVVGAAVNIALNAVLIPLLGYFAAGYTTLASYGVYVFMHYAFMRKIQKEEMGGARVYDPKVILGICAGFAACAVVLVLLYPHIVVRLVVVAAALAAAFVKRDRLLSLWRDMRKDSGCNGANSSMR